MDQSRQAMQRQNYICVVCAWCQASFRFGRATTATHGQVSYSICFDCFVGVFPELVSSTIQPPLSMSGP